VITSLAAFAATSQPPVAAFVGITAGFWHMSWIAGVAFLAAGLIAIGEYSTACMR
jgi:hypothetical protein